jgi:stage II sporulation protein AA (anti-sigma F factor antagonist)
MESVRRGTRPDRQLPVGGHVSDAQNALSVKVELPREDAVLLTVGGDLDAVTAAELQQHLARQLGQGRRHVLLDIAGVPFMDSSGMNIILRVYQEVRDAAGGVYVISPTPAVRRILDLTGVSLTVPILESVDEALSASARRTDHHGNRSAR